MNNRLHTSFWIGSGLFAAQLSWVIYNTYVPIFLQAGAPDFARSSAIHSAGFGLSAALTGVIMTLDNIGALLIQPLMGPLSDQTRTRWGRRIPFLVIFIPTAALGMSLIPIAPLNIPPALNGQIQALGGLFALFIFSLLVMLISMAVWRTPVFALMADVTPSLYLSQANGVLNLMAGLGGVLAFILGAFLYRIYPAAPFWLASISMLAALGLLLWKVREPKLDDGLPPGNFTRAADPISFLALLKTFRELFAAGRAPLVFMAAAVFFYMMGFHPIEAFFSSYGVSVLRLSESDAGLVLAAAYVTFILFAVPSGMLSGRIGRRRTMQMGLLLFAVVMGVAFLTPNPAVMVVLMGLGGIAWALIDINGLPVILDLSKDINQNIRPANTQAGAYTGVYFAATTLAATAGPILDGFLIDLTGRNYNMIFVIGPLFFILSFLALFGVRGGEAYL